MVGVLSDKRGDWDHSLPQPAAGCKESGPFGAAQVCERLRRTLSTRDTGRGDTQYSSSLAKGLCSFLPQLSHYFRVFLPASKAKVAESQSEQLTRTAHKSEETTDQGLCAPARG